MEIIVIILPAIVMIFLGVVISLKIPDPAVKKTTEEKAEESQDETAEELVFIEEEKRKLQARAEQLDRLYNVINRKYEDILTIQKDLTRKLDAEISKIISQNSAELDRRCAQVKLEYLEKTKALHDRAEELRLNKKALLDDRELLEKEKENYKQSVLSELSQSNDKLTWYKKIIGSLDINSDTSYRIKNNYFIRASMYPGFQHSLATDRAKSARKDDFCIDVKEFVAIKARIYSKKSGKTYETSLENCTCEDFQIHRLPCKHMLALAFSVNAFTREQPAEFVIFQEIKNALEQEEKIKIKNQETKNNLLQKESDLKEEIASFESRKVAFDEELKKQKSYLDILKTASEEKMQTFPYLAGIIANYKVQMLEIKVRDQVTKKELTSKLKSLEKKVAMLENQLAIYEYTFPILEELKTLDVHDLEQAVRDTDDSGFNYQWLSAEEYATLTSTEKQEKWLDRYFHARSRTAWEAGIKYERYIGYLCEKKGFAVRYTGALLKLKDMGRDLIVTKDKNTYIVQCKRFSENKEIHENHIFQLYGSIYHYKSENPGENVVGVFVTSSRLSEVACACAKDLSLQVFENVAFKDYPCIKCNVSSSGEKIYHLPFDQQYDNTHIGKRPGECYATTVREAQALGFRHAMKHTYIA